MNFSKLNRACLGIAIALTLVGTIACSESDSVVPSTPTAAFSQTDLVVGSGAEATAGRTLAVNYTGWLYDPEAPEQKGEQFDTSAGGPPFAFTLGAGQVIAGWDQGVLGMRVGGLRRLVIPADLAYGSSGRGSIPPNATLVFDVELLSIL